MDIHGPYYKTKRKIRKAFLMLLETKSFKDISIKDIVSEVDIVRQTFYLHYKDKDAILEEIIQDLVSGLTTLMTKVYDDTAEGLAEKLVKREHPIFTQYFYYIREHSDLFYLLLRKDNDTDFVNRFTRHMNASSEIRFSKWMGLSDKEPHDIEDKRKLYATATNNFVFTIMEWLKNGMFPCEEKMGAYHARLWTNYAYLHDIEADKVGKTLILLLQEQKTNNL